MNGHWDGKGWEFCILAFGVALARTHVGMGVKEGKGNVRIHEAFLGAFRCPSQSSGDGGRETQSCIRAIT